MRFKQGKTNSLSVILYTSLVTSQQSAPAFHAFTKTFCAMMNQPPPEPLVLAKIQKVVTVVLEGKRKVEEMEERDGDTRDKKWGGRRCQSNWINKQKARREKRMKNNEKAEACSTSPILHSSSRSFSLTRSSMRSIGTEGFTEWQIPWVRSKSATQIDFWIPDLPSPNEWEITWTCSWSVPQNT